MSGDDEITAFESDDELWAHIEEQEALLNKLGDAFSTVRDEPRRYEVRPEAPAPAAEMERLAREGSPAAQFNLFVAYRSGDGVVRDSEKAATWLLQSAEAGFPPAEYSVGHFWLKAKDVEKAFDWFMRAAKQNFGPAQFHVGALCGNAGDYEQAYVWSYLAEQNRVDGARGNLERASLLLSKEELDSGRLAISALTMGFREKGLMQ